MRTRARTALTLSFALAATSGFAGGGDKAEATKATHGRSRVVRSWPEPVTVGGKASMGRVDYIFDYGAGATTRVVYDGTGRVVESKTYAPGEVEVRPSDEEIAEAFERVRSDPELGRILEMTGGQLMGGFVLSEKAGMPCGPGTRCIHVQMNTEDGWGITRWVVVDLTRQTFAYRGYRPELSQQEKK